MKSENTTPFPSDSPASKTVGITNQSMKWHDLIDDTRFGLENYNDNKKGRVRTDFRRDYDRLVFSSPFRRLQNKTQVFPLPGSIFVHNRLTHSLEVSSVGRSMADEVALGLRASTINLSAEETLTVHEYTSHFGDIVAAACLAHDLGNPPFGHSGEKAISTFFSEGPGAALQSCFTAAQWNDLINFEGNANTFRMLTHTFKGRREGGFAMTYATLASIVKYPWESSLAGKKGKFGFFSPETQDFCRVFDKLKILRIPAADDKIKYARHPLVYLVEAADDICYEVMDLEDAHKLKILSTRTVTDLLMSYFDDESNRRDSMHRMLKRIEDPNEQIGYLRSCVIGKLVQCCASTFINNESALLNGTFGGSLLDNIPVPQRDAYKQTATLSWQKIYCAPEVIDVELAGNRIITFLLDKFINAVTHPELNYSGLLLSRVPTQYDTASDDLYTRVLAVLDHLSAMTDVYALDLYRKLNGTSLPAV